MAVKVSRSNFIGTFLKRQFATAAQQATSSGVQFECTTLPNKTIVTASKQAPVGLVKIAVAFRAGSRYECPENYGVSHVLRKSSGLSTAYASQFAIIRNLQQLGATFSATSDRELIVYTLESRCDNLTCTLDWFRKAISCPEFRPWELSDNVSNIRYELATIPPQAKVIDLIHKAAFRHGLGNSIFVEEHNIKKFGTESIQYYAACNLISQKAAVSGCGISLNALVGFTESLNLPSGCETPVPCSKYYGGDIRAEENTSLTHIIIASEAASLKSLPEALASSVLRYAVGSGSPIKRGAGSGPLYQCSDAASLSAFSVAHSDAGLFGIYIASSPCDIRKTIQDALKALKSGVTDQDVARGKALLRAEILYKSETCDGTVEDLVAQSLFSNQFRSTNDLICEVDKITTQQVKQVLEKFNSGKKSLAAVGRTGYVPFLDEELL